MTLLPEEGGKLTVFFFLPRVELGYAKALGLLIYSPFSVTENKSYYGTITFGASGSSDRFTKGHIFFGLHTFYETK